MMRPECHQCGSTACGLVYFHDGYWCVGCIEKRIKELEATLIDCHGLLQRVSVYDRAYEHFDEAQKLIRRITELNPRAKSGGEE